MNTDKTKYAINFLYIIFTICIVGLVICINCTQNTEVAGEIIPIEIQGKYSVDNGDTWTEFENYSQIPNTNKSIIITGKSVNNISKNTLVMLYLYKISARV